MNPYAEEKETLKTISLFHAYTVQEPWKRGQYLEYFAGKVNKPIGFVAMKLKGMQDLRTLAHIKSDCDQATHRGIPWGAAFYTSIK